MLRKSILRILFREAEIVQQVGVVIIAIRSSDHGRFAHSFIHSFTPFQRFGIHRFDKFHSVRLRRLALANFINLFRLQIRQPSVAKLLTHFERVQSSFEGAEFLRGAENEGYQTGIQISKFLIDDPSSLMAVDR
jgi:hypothetical protein